VAHILNHPKAYPSNITPDETKAIRELRTNKEITIFPADKGRATVIMDTTQYIHKMVPHTSGNPSNLILPTDPAKKYKDFLIQTLTLIEPYIPLSLYRQVYPTRKVTPTQSS
jgi:hypothetical protein